MNEIDFRGRYVRLLDAEYVIDALNHAVQIDDREETIQYILRCLQSLLKRENLCFLCIGHCISHGKSDNEAHRVNYFYVANDLDNPQLIQRCFTKEAFISISKVVQHVLHERPSRQSTPVTFELHADTPCNESEIDEYVNQYFIPLGYESALYSVWSSGEPHTVVLGMTRRPGEPSFSDEDQVSHSLFLRAFAPMMDSLFLQDHPLLDMAKMTSRQREVLSALLSGYSEKQIAKRIGRSTHTVHTFVKQIYQMYGVSSRGELMALFVDKITIRRLKETTSSGI